MRLRQHCDSLMTDGATLITPGPVSATDPYGPMTLTPETPEATAPEIRRRIRVRRWAGRQFRRLADGSYFTYTGKAWLPATETPQEGQFLEFDDEPGRRYRVAACTRVRQIKGQAVLRWDVWLE